MGGMFPSTQPLVVVMPCPIFAITTDLQYVNYGNLLTLANLQLRVYDPNNTPIATAALTAFPTAGVSITQVAEHLRVTLDPSIFVDGVWAFNLEQIGSVPPLAPDGSPVTASAQWGGLADLIVAINTETQTGGTMYTNVERTRKAVGNKWEANSTTVPTTIILYDDDGVTQIASRAISNADGSAVNPAQILDLGEIA